MIFGNPDKFAIFVDIVREWSNPDFEEGLFLYILGGSFCTSKLPENSATISVYMRELSSTIEKLSSNGYENPHIFNSPIAQAYSELSASRFVPFEEDTPDDAVEDYTHSITIGDMLRGIDDEIYLVSDGVNEKILCKNNLTKQVSGIVFEQGYVVEVMRNAVNWWSNQNLKNEGFWHT